MSILLHSSCWTSIHVGWNEFCFGTVIACRVGLCVTFVTLGVCRTVFDLPRRHTTIRFGIEVVCQVRNFLTSPLGVARHWKWRVATFEHHGFVVFFFCYFCCLLLFVVVLDIHIGGCPFVLHLLLEVTSLGAWHNPEPGRLATGLRPIQCRAFGELNGWRFVHTIHSFWQVNSRSWMRCCTHMWRVAHPLVFEIQPPMQSDNLWQANSRRFVGPTHNHLHANPSTPAKVVVFPFVSARGFWARITSIGPEPLLMILALYVQAEALQRWRTEEDMSSSWWHVCSCKMSTARLV